MATRITQPLTINGEGKTVILDGFDFTELGYVKIYNAEKVSIINCRVYNLSASGSRNYWLETFGDKETKIQVSSCYFGNNNENIYNLMELNTKLSNGSKFSNNYFVMTCCTHNHINIYGASENATIYINNNIFEYSDGTVRIGTKEAPHCTFYIEGNTVQQTATNDWRGLVLIQPYGTQTTTFANMTVYINNTVIDSDQVFYMYNGSKDLSLTESNIPKVYINGVLHTTPILS